jgi:hypothetical protein
MCRENMAFMVGSAMKTMRIVFVNPATQSILIHLAVMTKKEVIIHSLSKGSKHITAWLLPLSSSSESARW